MFERLKSLLTATRNGWPGARERLVLGDPSPLVYAVGDVHGCVDLLENLEARIVADAADAPGGKLIVMLGDYVDRGPATARAIEHLRGEPPGGFERICLAGNHDVMMLQSLTDPEAVRVWLSNGGADTLMSYGIPESHIWGAGLGGRRLAQLMDANIPDEHFEFLKALPVALTTPRAIFVHAQIATDRPIDTLDDDHLTWARTPARPPEPGELPIVHGHTPVETVAWAGRRLDVDTGAVFSGVLTAVRVSPEGAFAVLSTADDTVRPLGSPGGAD